MSHLDDELKRAVEESEADQAERPVVIAEEPHPLPAARRPRKELGLLLGLLVVAGAILALVMTSFDGAAIYSKTVDQALMEKDSLSGRNLNLQGVLVKGSITKRDDPCEYRFRLQKNGKQLEIRYPQCVVPDTFRDVPDTDVEVTATGKLASEGHFQASAIMAKCPSKYDMKQKAAAGEKAPHATMAIPAPAAKAD
jgi:cytochrome c-type biogenesis protein CcmE